MSDINNEKLKDEDEDVFSNLCVSVKVASGDDYILSNSSELHKQIEEVINLDFYHPKYQIWRVFLYRYLYANCDPYASERFTRSFMEQDRKRYSVNKNRTSKTIASYISCLHTTCTSIFANITADDFTEVLKASEIIINNKMVLLRIIQSDLEFKTEIFNTLNINTYQSIYIAYLLVICRYRWFGFWDDEISDTLLPKWNEWCAAYKTYFTEIQDILKEKIYLYAYYNDICKHILFRLLDYSILSLKNKKIVGIMDTYGKDYQSLDTLTKDFIKDYVVNFPLYNSISFDFYKTWNILYNFYFGQEQNILDYYRLFLIGGHLYNKNMKAIEDMRYYILHTDIGLECVRLRKIELYNMNVDQEYAGILLEEYFDNLVVRGIIDARRKEEVLYATK